MIVPAVERGRPVRGKEFEALRVTSLVVVLPAPGPVAGG